MRLIDFIAIVGINLSTSWIKHHYSLIVSYVFFFNGDFHFICLHLSKYKKNQLKIEIHSFLGNLSISVYF